MLPLVVVVLLPPLQETTPPHRTAKRVNVPRMVRQRQLGIANKRTQARVAPPLAYHGNLERLDGSRDAVVGAVVVMVRVDV